MVVPPPRRSKFLLAAAQNSASRTTDAQMSHMLIMIGRLLCSSSAQPYNTICPPLLLFLFCVRVRVRVRRCDHRSNTRLSGLPSLRPLQPAAEWQSAPSRGTTPLDSLSIGRQWLQRQPPREAPTRRQQWPAINLQIGVTLPVPIMLQVS